MKRKIVSLMLFLSISALGTINCMPNAGWLKSLASTASKAAHSCSSLFRALKDLYYDFRVRAFEPT